MVLILDKDMVRGYLCDYSSSGSGSRSMLLTAACSAGIVDTLLDWISPELLAKQVDWDVVNVVIMIRTNGRQALNKKVLAIPSLVRSFHVPSVFLSLLLVLP